MNALQYQCMNALQSSMYDSPAVRTVYISPAVYGKPGGPTV